MGKAARVAIVTFAQLSDIGRVRTRNEDYVGAFEPADPELLRARGRLFVVADGMGGYARGDVASRLAVESLHHTYFEPERSDKPFKRWPVLGGNPGDDVREFVR